MIRIFVVILALQVRAGPSISGIVRDPAGLPVSGAVVEALVEATAVSTVRTGPDGAFALPADVHVRRVRVSAPGFTDVIVDVVSATGGLSVQLQPLRLAETVQVSANPERLRVATPVSATTIDRQELSAAPSLTVDDHLRSIPGFTLFRRSSSRVANPTVQGVTLRGLAASGASRSVVTADGAPLNDPFGGWVYWDRVPAAAIDSIEVVRGGSSDLFGSDAMGGAIRITSARSTGARVWADGGSHGSARIATYAGRQLEQWSAHAALDGSTSDGFVIVAPESRGPIDVPASQDYLTGQAGAEAATAIARLAVRGSYFSEDRGNGTPFQTNATIVRQLSGSAAGSAPGGAWNFGFTGASQDYDQSFSAVAQDRASERPTTLQHVDTASAGANFEWLGGTDRFAALAAASWRQVRADLTEAPASSTGPASLTSARQRILAVSAQTSLQAAETVSVGAGVRGEMWRSEAVDGAEQTITRILPRASIAWQPGPSVSVRTAVHHAYRTPTINELYRPFRVGSVLTQANVSLLPERTYGIEGAALVHRGQRAIRIAGFWTRLDDPIVNVTLESSPSLILRQRRNAGQIRAAGVEVEADSRLGRDLAVTVAWAWIDSVFTEGAGLEGLRVPQVPRWQASAGVRYAPSRVLLSADWRYIGEQFDDDRNQFPLEPSSMLNARAGWRMRPSLEVFAALENAFDEEQDVGRTPVRTVGLPRTARVGLRWGR